jgi:hypothetical protein
MCVCRLATCVCVCLQYRSSPLSVLKTLWSSHDRDVVERTSESQRDKESVFHAGNVVVVYYSFSVNLVQSDY